MKSKRIRNIGKESPTHYVVLLAVVFVLAIAGVAIWAMGSAATPYSANEPELGNVTSPASIVTDTAASGGKAVKFGAAVTPTPTPTPTPPGGQTLGVGGVATPAGAVLTNTDSSSALTISSGGTQASPKVYDGQSHTVGTITVRANWVVVQNFNVRASGQYGVYSEGTGITIQNNDIKGIHISGDGDLNAITFFGNNTTIAYNTAIDFVSGDAGDSHTDAIQTWTSSSHPTGSTNVTIKGNKFSGPANPSRLASIASIHQCVMAEGLGAGGNTGGSGTSSNWLIADNYFKDSWNQCIKLDGVANAVVTRNTFAGDSDYVIANTTASSGFKYYADNKVTGNYGSVGTAITAGSGPTSL